MTFSETPLFYAFLFGHLAFLITGLGAVIITDVVAFRWIRGKSGTTAFVKAAEVTQRAVWTGWIGMVVTGAGLITIKGFVDSLTAIKIFLVLMVGLNGFALHFLKHAVSGSSSYGELPAVHKYYVYSTGLVSLVGWWGAFAIGFMHRHIRHYWDWPATHWPAIYSIAAVWFVLVLIGALWSRQYHRR
ncbi:MAG TPA: hypothetical protein VD862_04220 [Candidatus Paceibacterota bacterium]|nr:hypothetical protein [Candidatus Paceibacterota bacterium]